MMKGHGYTFTMVMLGTAFYLLMKPIVTKYTGLAV